MDAVAAEGLSYSYEGSEELGLSGVFEDLSIAIAARQVTCIVGPSGCGKTTFLNLIAGFIAPTRGKISIRTDDGRDRVGYIFQQDALLPWRTVRGNVCLAAELRNSDPALDSERISGYLRAFNLDESVLSKYPAELSGGMRQRISIIQSLMADPSILLLDEPFSSLDFYTKLKLETDFRSLVIARGMTAVFVTHDIEEAIAVGDRVVIFGKSPRGIVHDIRIDFADGPRLSPEAVRSHRQFGEYFSEIWGELRDAT
jgi:NitT/TauT family transport system ATP-binding protein